MEWTRLWKEWYQNGKGKGKFGLDPADIKVDERGDWGKGELENLGLWKGRGEGQCMIWVNTTNVKRMMDVLHDLTQGVGESKLRIRGLDNLWTEFVESFLESVEQVLEDSEGRWGWRRLRWRGRALVQEVGRRWCRRSWNIKRLMQWGLIAGHFGGLIWLTRALKVRLGSDWLTRMLRVILELRLWRSGSQKRKQEVKGNGKAKRGAGGIQEHSHRDLLGDDLNRYSQLDPPMREMSMADQNSQTHAIHPYRLVDHSQFSHESSSPSPLSSSLPLHAPLYPSLPSSDRFLHEPLYSFPPSSVSSSSQITPAWSPISQPHLNFNMASTSSSASSFSSKAESTYVFDISEESEESSGSVDSYVFHLHDPNHIHNNNHNFVSHYHPYQPPHSLSNSSSSFSSSPTSNPIEIRAPSEAYTTKQNPDQDLQTCDSQHVTSNQNTHIGISILKTIRHPIFFCMIFLLITYLTILLCTTSSLYSYPSFSSSPKTYQSSINTSLILKQNPHFFFGGENGKDSKYDNNIPPPRAILIPTFQESITFPLFYYEQWWKNDMRILKELDDFVQFIGELKSDIRTRGCGKLDMNSQMKSERKKGKKTDSRSRIIRFFDYFSSSLDNLETQFEKEYQVEINRELGRLRTKVEGISDLTLSDTFMETKKELLESINVGGKLGRSWVKGVWDAGRWPGLRVGDGRTELMELEQGLRGLVGRLREKKKEGSMKFQWEEECWFREEREVKRMMEEEGKEDEKWEDYMGDKCIVGMEEWEDMKRGVFKRWGRESVDL